MPQVINIFVYRVLRLVKEFFGADEFEYGIADLSDADNDRTIFIATQREVRRVWFSMTPTGNPYIDEYGQLHGVCYISEAVPVPGGFEFRVMLDGQCHINWFAIES